MTAHDFDMEATAKCISNDQQQPATVAETTATATAATAQQEREVWKNDESLKLKLVEVILKINFNSTDYKDIFYIKGKRYRSQSSTLN